MKMKNWKMFPVGRMLITKAGLLEESPLFILIFWAAAPLCAPPGASEKQLALAAAKRIY